MEQAKLDRINELYHKSKTVDGLTTKELEEQAILRREYIDSYKRSLVGQLENTYILEPDGSKTKVTRKGKTDD